MQNPICISTGCVYELSDDRNDLIEKIRQFSPIGIMGIELSFAYPEYLLNFDIDNNNLEYLQGLEFNSIHAPRENITYGENKTSKEILQKISELYKQINARNVVFHEEQIEDYNSIISNNFVSSIENDDWRRPRHNVEDIKSILDKNKKLKFTLDFAHALSVSSSDIAEYINYFKDKLIEIHLSVIDKDLEKHDFLHKYDSAEIRNLLQPLKTVFVPVILEAAVSNLEEMKFIKKEIEYIKNL